MSSILYSNINSNLSLPTYINRYNQIKEAIEYSHDIVKLWNKESDQGQYELEARFGRWCGQHFESGVSKQFIEKVLAMFKTFPHWHNVSDWEETTDYYYINQQSSSEKKQTIRSTVHPKPDPITGKATLAKEHIIKECIKKIDLQYMEKKNNLDYSIPVFTSQDCHYDVRICLNFERKVNPVDLPEIVNPNMVRIKSRKYFYYKSDEFPCQEPIWRFDITRSWSGNSRTEAELKKISEQTNYEMELECLNPQSLMVSPSHDSVYVICSLLLKMKDFVTNPKNDDFKWVPVQFKTQ